MRELAEVDLSAKRLHCMTGQIGADRCSERALHVEAFRAKPLAQRTAANPNADVPELGVVMMDGPWPEERVQSPHSGGFR